MSLKEIVPGTTMGEILEAYPAAKVGLFQRFHIGGCQSCGYQTTDTLEQVIRTQKLQASVEEMIACIRKVVRGQRHVSPDIAQTLLLEHIQNGDAPLGCLTQRELSVLVLLSQGHHRSEISAKLCVSPKTISTYRTRLMRKLGARSDVELTHLSLRHGLISPIEGRAP